jgi:hypothetical protein
MGIKSFLKRKPVLLLFLVIFIVLVVFISNSFVDHQQYNLYCHKLAWGMNKGQVKDLLTSIGSLNWREFAIEGTKIEKVQLSFKDPLLVYSFGGVMILYFDNESYSSAVIPVPVGEEKGLCKKPE